MGVNLAFIYIINIGYFQAFEKTRDTLPYSAIKGTFVLVTEEYYERGIWMAKNCFLPHDPLSKGLGIEWCDELEGMWINTFKQGLSVMIVNPNNGAPMCLRATRTDSPSGQPDLEQVENQSLLKMIKFHKYSESKIDFYKEKGAAWCIHFFGLCTSEAYRQQGLATTLMEFSLDLARNLEIVPLFIRGEGSSNYSQRIYEKLNFDLMNDIIYKDYNENGEQIIKDTGDHKSMAVYCFVIKDN